MGLIFIVPCHDRKQTIHVEAIRGKLEVLDFIYNFHLRKTFPVPW